MTAKSVIAFDIGGTHLRAAIVTSRKQVHLLRREPVTVRRGPAALVEQITKVVNELHQSKFRPKAVGIGCAGPLDPESGILLDPTNFKTNDESWGKVELLKNLKQRLKGFRFILENDAAAAVLGEAWHSGEAKNKNVMVMTLGTGVGVGVICNGELLRAGRLLHPEASHISINAFDSSAPCGCGLNGCVEAYLSGTNFTRRIAKRWGEPNLTGEELVNRAQRGVKPAVDAFVEYGELMAHAIQAYAVLFASEKIVLAGGFSVAAEFFLPTTEKFLEQLMVRRRQGVDMLPKISVSSLGDDLGLLGAARAAMMRL